MTHSVEEIMQQLEAAHVGGIKPALKVLVELLVDMESRLDALESVAHQHQAAHKVYDGVQLSPDSGMADTSESGKD